MLKTQVFNKNYKNEVGRRTCQNNHTTVLPLPVANMISLSQICIHKLSKSQYKALFPEKSFSYLLWSPGKTHT